MNHYVYKIINTKTNQFYIGVRSCKCLIEDDPYMGSSSEWTKDYIKSNKGILKKEILQIYPTRKLANGGEVYFLKSVENNTLCVNKYFGYTPDCSGIKQTEEWINKRKRCGKDNGMYGKSHSEETKELMRQKLKGRHLSQETKNKIGSYHRNKIVSQETKDKLSSIKSKLRKVTDLKSNEIFITTLPNFCKHHPDCDPNNMRKYCNKGWIYHKRYIIENCEAFISDNNSKLGENGEHPEVDNPVGSVGNA